MSDNNLSPDQVAVLKQSPRSATVTDVEDLCDTCELQAAKIAELERLLRIATGAAIEMAALNEAQSRVVCQKH